MSGLIELALAIVIVSGILNMVEASLFSYPLHKARLYAAKKDKFGTKAALAIREKPLKTVAAFVILSTTVNIAGSVIVGSLAAREFQNIGVGIFGAVLTFLTITFSEIIPKNIGERWNHIIFPLAAIPLSWLTTFLAPLVWFLEIISKPFTFGASPFITSEEEIALLTAEGAREGTIAAREAEMIERVFKLNDVTAGDMMTPKPFVTFIDGEKTLGEMKDKIIGLKHSRIPVYEGDDSHIVGVVHLRDLLTAISTNDVDKKISYFMRKPLIVSDDRVGDALLSDFQGSHSHLAIVVSEYGNIVGVVGLEDVLEELVGEIIDEKDIMPETIKRISRNEVLAHGQTKIVNLNRFFNVNIHSKKTLHGFLLEKMGRLPKSGERHITDDLEFIIEEIIAHKITKVRVIKKSPAIG